MTTKKFVIATTFIILAFMAAGYVSAHALFDWGAFQRALFVGVGALIWLGVLTGSGDWIAKRFGTNAAVFFIFFWLILGVAILQGVRA